MYETDALPERASRIVWTSRTSKRSHALSNVKAAFALLMQTTQALKQSWLTCASPDAGELDFQADEAFLEAMVTFALSVPLADIWQDRAWARPAAAPADRPVRA